jgi:UDP-N-acetylmuramoyl-tripeptide--D-alanyl-D-alanine ligase
MLEKIYALFLQSTGVCTDTRNLEKDNLFFALKGPSFNGNLFATEALKQGALACIVDEVITPPNPNILQVDDVLQTLQLLAQHHRKTLNTTVVALTGSNGKTTTKELISRILQTTYHTLFTLGNLNNHIGVPLTLLRLKKEHEIAVIEMGANHQGEIQSLSEIVLPDYGLITNIGKAHLEGFGGIEGIIKGKTELYRHLMHNSKTLFCRKNNPLLAPQCNDYENVIYYSTEPDTCIYGNIISSYPTLSIQWFENQKKSEIITTQITGDYNLENLLASICIGRHFKVTPENIQSAIENYKPDNQRSQIVKSGSNTIILDAYNANPTSMAAALNNLSEHYYGKKIIILGEMLELGNDALQEHQLIVDQISTMEKDLLILVGDHFLRTTLNEQALRFKTSDEATTYLKQHPLSNCTILIKGSRGSRMEKVLEALG